MHPVGLGANPGLDREAGPVFDTAGDNVIQEYHKHENGALKKALGRLWKAKPELDIREKRKKAFLAIRMPQDELEKLRKEAKRLGAGTSSLAQAVLSEWLRLHSGDGRR